MKAKSYGLFFLILLVLFYGVFYLVDFRDSLLSPDLVSKSSFEIFEYKKLTRPPKTGWFIDEGASFYYKKGTKLTGWQEIDENWLD